MEHVKNVHIISRQHLIKQDVFKMSAVIEKLRILMERVSSVLIFKELSIRDCHVRLTIVIIQRRKIYKLMVLVKLKSPYVIQDKL